MCSMGFATVWNVQILHWKISKKKKIAANQKSLINDRFILFKFITQKSTTVDNTIYVDWIIQLLFNHFCWKYVLHINIVFWFGRFSNFIIRITNFYILLIYHLEVYSSLSTSYFFPFWSNLSCNHLSSLLLFNFHELKILSLYVHI